MAKMQSDELIENLIDRFAKDLDDDDFIEALEEMESRATIALEARREELGLDD